MTAPRRLTVDLPVQDGQDHLATERFRDVLGERDRFQFPTYRLDTVGIPSWWTIAATGDAGVAAIGHGYGGTDADALFAEADTAAYRAKASGRGRAELFDETLRRQLNQRAELEAAIAAGLVNGEMQVAYQPVIDVASDRLSVDEVDRWAAIITAHNRRLGIGR